MQALNGALGVLALFHLSYLGALFDVEADDGVEEQVGPPPPPPNPTACLSPQNRGDWTPPKPHSLPLTSK